MDNSCGSRPFRAGYCDTIEVTIHSDNSVSVGQRPGHPRRRQGRLRQSALEIVHTVLHAGGKFGDGGYKVSGGLQTVGALRS
ncbi:MAG: hypothetical protein R2857_02050 [Vampirovibrionales bacterium]